MSFYFQLEGASTDVILLEDGTGNLLIEPSQLTLIRHVKTSQSENETTKTTVNINAIAILQ